MPVSPWSPHDATWGLRSIKTPVGCPVHPRMYLIIPAFSAINTVVWPGVSVTSHVIDTGRCNCKWCHLITAILILWSSRLKYLAPCWMLSIYTHCESIDVNAGRRKKSSCETMACNGMDEWLWLARVCATNHKLWFITKCHSTGCYLCYQDERLSRYFVLSGWANSCRDRSSNRSARNISTMKLPNTVILLCFEYAIAIGKEHVAPCRHSSRVRSQKLNYGSTQ